MSVLQFRLPGNDPRRTERRKPQVVVDERPSQIDPRRTIKVPVLARPKVYDWRAEIDIRPCRILLAAAFTTGVVLLVLLALSLPG